ncbi:MAG TPA: spore coat U domain-containing protein [Steroidobacteraceae bacterium]|nr:spore coat U domain-containing protein [Steroidobacteraceae bacterium]
MRKILMSFAAAAIVAASSGAQAVTITTTFQVTATVLKTCSVSAAALAFGNYTPGAGQVTGSTNVNVKCTKNTAFTVALDKGTTAGGTIPQRLMANGANTLEYNLFTTSGGATIFGDGTGGSQTVPGTGAGVATAVAVPVFGTLPDSANNQNAVPGAYADTITVSVNY